MEEKFTTPAHEDQTLEHSSGKSGDPSKKLYPAVPMYGPCNIRGLVEGEKKKWCTCGLSKTQPWCDGAHKGTGFKPLVWTVDRSQSLFQLCACKYTSCPPFCDATHTSLPCEVIARQKSCGAVHDKLTKLCTGCGWIPDF